MRATQIRCDDIQTNGQMARVITRKNHVIQTDIKIKQKFDGAMYKFPTPDDTLDKYRATWAQEYGHVPLAYDAAGAPRSTRVEIDDYPINKSIEKMSLFPLSAQNAFEDSPKDRAMLLPYLTETRIEKNNRFRLPTEVDEPTPQEIQN